MSGIAWGKDEMIAAREMGQAGTDVRLVGIALNIFKLSVECKAQESWNVHDWIKQAMENQLKGTDWLLVAKRSSVKSEARGIERTLKNPVVFMDFFAFLKMFEVVVQKRIDELGVREILESMKKKEDKPKLVKRRG